MITTIALLRKKQDMQLPLFFKYWRDVHGVLAARIQGFESYIQYHLGKPVPILSLPRRMSSPAGTKSRFHGIAEVIFKNEQARTGLAQSDVSTLIQQDERNVFQTSLLYSLPTGSSATCLDRALSISPSAGAAESAVFFMLIGRKDGVSDSDVAEIINGSLVSALSRHPSMTKVRTHALHAGDPLMWNTPDVDNHLTSATSFDVLLELAGTSISETLQGIESICTELSQPLLQRVSKLHLYRLKDRCVMVQRGLPTHLGLRGLDCMRTITAAGATNQLDKAVVEQIYGVSPAK